ncbi:HMD1-like protein [Mya arenaria]|uniref:HMD1-like protein n=1 Tax=Mya arenaria TaxID=6604 RepID=A0ABY7DMI2_MYAAR|nr:HMD1-like protein [Mya arenaria]
MTYLKDENRSTRTAFLGKTRTKDKYRVVYSDHQRLELEKEFHYSRYITIRRKAELAQTLQLSERQVKIWFQNRRAKERKQNKKREENQVLKMASDLSDLSDDSKHHMTSQMNMVAALPQHQVQMTAPSPNAMHAHNPFSYPEQVHMSPQNALSPHTHMTGSGGQFSSPNHLQLPISPGNDHPGAAPPQSCSVSPQPLAIKTDVDAIDAHE